MQITIPDWANTGPEDLEYRTYKMLDRVKSLNNRLDNGELMGVLYEVDDTLDYLYRYDATRQTEQEMLMIEGDWGPLSFVLNEYEEIAQTQIMDQLIDKAIDSFELLHSNCRKVWQKIEKNLKASYIADKKYFLSDGFVFVKTGDDMLHIYYFNKPIKNFTTSWKDFRLQHIKSQEWSQDDYFESLEEIVNKKSDKILIKAEIEIDVQVDKNAIAVLNHRIYTMLQRDYSF